jgi:large subunit ribosomal protein L2
VINLKEKFVLISKEKKISKLAKGSLNKSGRNNLGRITMRHRGGKNKNSVRIIDFNRGL